MDYPCFSPSTPCIDENEKLQMAWPAGLVHAERSQGEAHSGAQHTGSTDAYRCAGDSEALRRLPGSFLAEMPSLDAIKRR
jgi:hypothetical protein